MLAEIHRILGDLSAKMGTVLSDMAYIKEDVTEHKREIRALNGLPQEVSNLKAEVAALKADYESRVRALERDKMPKAVIAMIATVMMAFIGLLTYLGVTIK
jgi:peptidoglycan hydrolase CwlO-like protein